MRKGFIITVVILCIALVAIIFCMSFLWWVGLIISSFLVLELVDYFRKAIILDVPVPSCVESTQMLFKYVANYHKTPLTGLRSFLTQWESRIWKTLAKNILLNE